LCGGILHISDISIDQRKMLKRSKALPARRLKPRRKGLPVPRIKPGRVEDPARLDAIREHGCMICGAAPCEAHHIREMTGTGCREDDHKAFGLCAKHHRTGGMGVAFHAGPRTWERIHGTQAQFLEKTLVMMQSLQYFHKSD